MKYVSILVVLAVLVAGLLYFMLFSVSSDSKSMVNHDSAMVEELDGNEVLFESPKGTGTLESLRLLNEDLECTISYTPSDETPAVEGTYFVSSGNMRGDFLTESPDLSGQILSSMIINGETMYTWSTIEGETYGMKIDISAANKTTDEIQQPVSLDTNVKYDCKNWENVDRTVFVPPADVLFQDMSQLMKAGMEYGTIYEEGTELPN